MRRAALIFAPLILALAACQPPPPPPLTGTGMDMFAPVKMRLHPLSRIVAAAAATQPATPASPALALEARLEFSDQFGDITRAPGNATIRVFALGPLNIKGSELGTWTFDLSTPEANRNAYDRITRTYVFKIALPPEAAGHERLLVHAAFTLPNNITLTDERDLPTK